MQSKLVELELRDINVHHEVYERAHSRLVVLTVGLAIGTVIGLIALPMLLWPRQGGLRVVPESTWPLLALYVVWVAITVGAYFARQRAFARVREGCLKLRRAGYRIQRQDVHFSHSVFGVSQLPGDEQRTLDVNRLNARSLHAVMQ